jgi:LPS-assembly protein
MAAAFFAAALAPGLVAEAQTPTRESEDVGGASVILEADTLRRENNDQVIIAEGAVEARYEGRTLRAARVVYDRTRRTVRAQGGVVIIEADGSTQTAEEIEVYEDLGAGVAVGFGARFAPNGAIAANSAVRNADGSSRLERMVYTACPVCSPETERPAPTWTLRARRATQNPETKMITYRDATLNVRGAPVLYLPYFAHPDPTAGRRSGLLSPDFGRSNRFGAFYEQPYYWAISPSDEAIVTAMAYQKVAPLLNTTYRRKFFSGDLILNTSFTQEKDFDSDGEKFGDRSWRSHVFGQGRFQITDYWHWGFGLERASDDLYLRRYELSGAGEQRGQIRGDITRLVSQAFVTGQDARSYVNVTAATIQGLRLADEASILPLVLPVAELERVVRDPLFDGQLRLKASTVNVVRNEGLDSSRLSAGANWMASRAVGPGVVVSPFAESRADYYRVADGPTGDESLARAVGVAGIEARWPFLRAGSDVALVVEPIAVAALGSNGGNDPRIPNEDSIAFEVDDATVLRPTATPNYDLWEPGPRAAMGLRASAQFKTGTATATVGRRWRQEADAVFDEQSNLDGTSSDYVGAVAAAFPKIGGDVRFRLSEDAFEVVRLDAGGYTNIGRITANVRYFQADQGLQGIVRTGSLNAPAPPPGARREEISGLVSVKVAKNWSTSYTVRRDLASNINLSQVIGLNYVDDCTYLALSYSREETFDRRLGPNEGFQIKFGFTSLGLSGN